MSGTFLPSDHVQRERIARSLDETLFVEAGAGTGKTAALVSRLVNLVASGRTTIDRLAAITFTEAAAAELRERVRRALEDMGRSAEASEPYRQRCLEASHRMEQGSIQTLHGFAASLLRELPLEAGLPPDFSTVEAIEADLGFEERWARMLDDMLESQDLAPFLSQALRLGLSLSSLREVAKGFHENYDLLSGPLGIGQTPAPQAATRIAESRAQLRRLLPLARDGEADPLASHAARVAALGDRLDELRDDSARATNLLARWGSVSGGNRSNQGNWSADPESGVNGCKLIKDLLKELESTRAEELEKARRAVLMPVLETMRRMVLEYAEERRISGKAEFHDLLVWARDLLRDNPDARSHFQRKYSHILIDEFQDTDPIQAEIAFFLAGHDNQSGDGWTGLKLQPGKLFLVGDPKQSIYRFRRADIATMDLVKGLLRDATVNLEQNFRCQEPIVIWVNAVFGPWFGDENPAIQPPYSPLTHRWSPPQATPPLGVHWFGGVRDEGADTVRTEEAVTVASIARRVQSEPWTVRDEESGELRAARYQDICVLLPARTGLPALEQALVEANVTYRIESQSMLFRSQDVRELLDCLRAIDAPVHQVALVAALRSSAFGCSDVELLEFVESGGNLNYLEPGKGAGEVLRALEVLRSFHRARTWEEPDRLIERFIRERRMVEACFGNRRPRERWRRLRFVVQRARAFARVGGSSLRTFLDWMERQAEEGARMVESPVPEIDENALRIMTIHAAKGLEFPIVLLAGLGSGPAARTGPVIVDRTGRTVDVRVSSSVGAGFSTEGYEAARQREVLAAEAEAVRLIYVASTRARDHLVVSLFRGKRGRTSAAAVIADTLIATPELWREIVPDQEAPTHRAGETAPVEGVPDTAADREAWGRGRETVVRRAASPQAVAATRLAQIDKEEADEGEVHYRRGRAGTNIGRAVHTVLQTIDLATGADVDQASRAQAAAEGIADRWREIARLARVAIRSPVVKRAVASGRYYREVFVSAPVLGGLLVEGFIDLLFETDTGLVIVDYKTDAVQGDEAAEDARARYRTQIGAYALALERSTGLPVREALLLFLHTDMVVGFDDVGALQSLALDRAREWADAG